MKTEFGIATHACRRFEERFPQARGTDAKTTIRRLLENAMPFGRSTDSGKFLAASHMGEVVVFALTRDTRDPTKWTATTCLTVQQASTNSQQFGATSRLARKRFR